MTIQQMIPLNRLVPSKANARKTGGTAGIDELAASIKAHGLLQNLQVRAADNGTFEVAAGMRRFRALKRLAKEKAIAKDADIPCHVRDGEDAAEISLAENIVRLPMHPADQFAAFKALSDDGKGPEEIAGRFGCSPATVKQRLRLASVSPVLIDAYRADEMSLDQLTAFTVSDDRNAQETAWAELPAWNRHPDTIRRILTRAHVEACDRRARFVGIEAYTAAGGHVLRDLFTPEHDGYLTDPALLDRLATERLEGETEAIRAEGGNGSRLCPSSITRACGNAAAFTLKRSHPTKHSRPKLTGSPRPTMRSSRNTATTRPTLWRRKSRRSATKSMRCRKEPSAGRPKIWREPASLLASDMPEGSPWSVALSGPRTYQRRRREPLPESMATAAAKPRNAAAAQPVNSPPH
ncbi:MAG: ParB/RepB/Spo0J family partition protein [Stellaceae bacterium]